MSCSLQSKLTKRKLANVNRKSLRLDEGGQQYVFDPNDTASKSPRIFKHDDKHFKVRTQLNTT